MLTLFYAPLSRSSRMMALVEELGIADQIDARRVDILRFDGSGRRDPANAHPEGKVPLLIHDGTEIWESTAIALYLTELFPDSGLGRPIGHPERGGLLSWMAYYGDVVEPVVVCRIAGIDHPNIRSAWRDLPEVHARIDVALADGRDYLLRGGYSIADLIVASTFMWHQASAPTSERGRAWLARCQARLAGQKVWQREQAMLAARVA